MADTAFISSFLQCDQSCVTPLGKYIEGRDGTTWVDIAMFEQHLGANLLRQSQSSHGNNYERMKIGQY